MIQTEYPTVPHFTVDQMTEAYKRYDNHDWPDDLRRTTAAIDLLGDHAPCELVDHVAGMIRQALEERGPQ